MTSSHSTIRRQVQFYPGLAAFTDAIEAVPQETIRHFTLLREVDAKASGPEDLLRTYIRQALPAAHLSDHPDPVADPLRNLLHAHHRDGQDGDALNAEDTPEGGTDEQGRQSRLRQIRLLISDLLLTLDEKIHVISTASEALSKHMARIDDAYDTVLHEIDPVIRQGNPAHWGYAGSILDELGIQGPAGAEHLHFQNAHTSPQAHPEAETGANTGTVSRGRDALSRRHLQVPDTSDHKLHNTGPANSSDLSAVPHDGSPNIPAAKRRKGTAHSSHLAKASAIGSPSILARSGGQSNPATASAVLGSGSGSGKNHAPHSLSGNAGGSRSSTSKKRAFGPHPPSSTSSPVSQNFSDIRAPNPAASSNDSLMVTGNESGGRSAATGHRNPRSKPQSTKPEGPRASSKSEIDVKQEEKPIPLEVGSNSVSKSQHDKFTHEGNHQILESTKEVGQTENAAAYPGASEHMPVKAPTKEDKPPSSTTPGPDKSIKTADGPDKSTSRSGASSISKATSKVLSASEPSRSSQPSARKTMAGKVSKSAKGPPGKDDGVEKTGKEADTGRGAGGGDDDDGEGEGEGDLDEMRMPERVVPFAMCGAYAYAQLKRQMVL
ncbi:hypothetical protein Dda_1348 [Drechslerella dactyloides]|uniref:Inhibitor of growth protein N-terminal histone-binding domain-containing protein n=1 Tax=Drechslerella dactyloides TaxID=74499 RepID=A0AAD6J292_DREDA|nr:hypothetical protein Dda_1348 [Drechslerella dactyloides]